MSRRDIHGVSGATATVRHAAAYELDTARPTRRRAAGTPGISDPRRDLDPDPTRPDRSTVAPSGALHTSTGTVPTHRRNPRRGARNANGGMQSQGQTITHSNTRNETGQP